MKRILLLTLCALSTTVVAMDNADKVDKKEKKKQEEKTTWQEVLDYIVPAHAGDHLEFYKTKEDNREIFLVKPKPVIAKDHDEIVTMIASLNRLPGLPKKVTALAVSHTHWANGFIDGTVSVNESGAHSMIVGNSLDENPAVELQPAQRVPIKRLAFSHDGRKLAALFENNDSSHAGANRVKVWELKAQSSQAKK